MRLKRTMYDKEMECDKCGDMIPARTKRFMCQFAECAYHVCDSCKAKGGESKGEAVKRDRAEVAGVSTPSPAKGKQKREEYKGAAEDMSEGGGTEGNSQGVVQPLAQRMQEVEFEDRMKEIMRQVVREEMKELKEMKNEIKEVKNDGWESG